MTQPLTTPSGVPQSTPTPRYPDGSPKPAARVAEERKAIKLTSEQAGTIEGAESEAMVASKAKKKR